MYTLDIIVSKEDVRVIKEHFSEFLESSDGFTITVHSDSGVECPHELNDVLKKLFFHFLMTIHFGQFKGVN
jgi:hypothetical protein